MGPDLRNGREYGQGQVLPCVAGGQDKRREMPPAVPPGQWWQSESPYPLQRHVLKSDGIRAGYPVQESRKTWVKMNEWQSVAKTVVRFVLGLKWFRRQQVVFLGSN